MNSIPPIPNSQHGMAMTLPPGSVGQDGALQSPGAGLPPGTRLGEFEITGLIGEGGFGIVYMAMDHLLGRQVALKEYMPSALATRDRDAQVGVKSERHAEAFEAGRRSFINEARLLAQFDHPALVKVFRFWEANGTAYMVMPYYRGRTLRQALADMPSPPAQAWVARILLPLIDALETLHEAQCYHRDIAPDNILLLDNGQPLLLDFGAARRVIGDMTQALTVILKPGFAPMEQYANGPEMKQGPWTDVYALAAVVYYCATLKAPVPSVSRMMKDTLEPFSSVAADRFDARFCTAIDKGLAVSAEERIRTMGDFRQALGLGTAAGANDLAPTIIDPEALQRTAAGWVNQASTRGAAEEIMPDTNRTPPARPEKPWTPNADVQMERLSAGGASADGTEAARWLPVGAAAIVLALIAGGAWYWMQDPEPGAAPPAPDASASAGGFTAAPALPAPAPAPLAVPAAPAVPQLPSPPPLASAPPMAPPAPYVPPAAPFEPPAPLAAPPAPDVVPSLVPQQATAPSSLGPTTLPDGASLVGRIIDGLHAQRDPAWPVSVDVRMDRVRIGQDRLSFRLRSDRDGYVYLLMQGTDRSHFYQLFPNGLDSNNRVRKNVDMALPRSNWEMVAGGPPGLNRFIALVTPSPRDFSTAGLDTAQTFGEFNTDLASRVFADRGPAPFAGQPKGCKLAADACNAYGAALFEIEEY